MFNKKAKSEIFHCNFFPKNRRGQVGETMTWLIATIIIIVILTISVFIAQIYAGKKGKIYESRIADSLAEKSFFSFLLTKDVWTKLQNDGNLKGSNGILAKNIFDNYKEEYSLGLWIGVLDRASDDKEGVIRNQGLENDFFGKKPSGYIGAVGYGAVISQHYYIDEKIKLNENKDIELILMEK